MNANLKKIVFSLLFLCVETVLSASSYEYRRDYQINTDRRFDYQTASNYSGLDNFWIDSRSAFLNNRDYAPLISLARRDNGLNNFLAARVAPTINLTDYAGYKIAENGSWQNYSTLSRNYEPQNYAQVVKEGDNYKSFEVSSRRGGWKVKEQVENIAYGANSLPNKLTLTTSDLAGNTFTQELSNISYSRATDQSRLEDLTRFSLAKSKQEGMYGFDNLYLSLKDQTAPPHYLVSAFRLAATDPAGNKTEINFSEITWSKNKIVSFRLSVPLSLEGRGQGEGDTIIQVNTSGDKIKIGITENNLTAIYTLNEDITTEEFLDKLQLGVNPLEILGSNKIQLGEAKLVFLTKTYTDEGILDGGPKKFSIDYGITDKKTSENEIKTNLAKLEQIAPAAVRKAIADQPIKTLEKEALVKLQQDVVTAIEQELSRYQKTPEIKNDWQLTLTPADQLKLKLVDNQIVSETKLDVGKTDAPANSEISEVINPAFALENGELKAISGIYTKNTGEIQKLTTPKAEAINNLPESIMTKEQPLFDRLKDTGKFSLIVTKTFFSEITTGWGKNANKTEALSKGITEGFFIEKGEKESDSKFIIHRKVENFLQGYEDSNATINTELNNGFQRASEKNWLSKYSLRGGIIAAKSSLFAVSLIVETGADVGKLGSDSPAIARSFKSAISSFKEGANKAGWRQIGIGSGLVVREASRIAIIGGIIRGAQAGVRARTVGAIGTMKNPEEIGNMTKTILKETEIGIPVAKAETKIVEERVSNISKTKALVNEQNVTKVSRLDYSKDFEKDIIRNFKPGNKIFNGKLNDDLVLVQFHADKSIGLVGEGRSLKYWTSIGQANKFKTMDDIMRKLALLPEWGERAVVSVARIPKGTEITYCVGKAVQKVSETGQVFRGGGGQYLFKDFDPSWVVEIRKILK